MNHSVETAAGPEVVGRKKRLSNMELLRIVAMLMVVAIHMCYYSFGTPTRAEVLQFSPFAMGRMAVQSFTVVCVDVFVLLSGYFGINASWKRLCGLLFQVLLLTFPIGLLYVWKSHGSGVYSAGRCLTDAFMLGGWFVRAYVMLYVMSPVLNAFVRFAAPEQLKRLTFFLLLLVTLWGWMLKIEFSGGYSAMFFAVLYLLGRCVRLYPGRLFRLRWQADLLVYVGCSLLTLLTCILGTRFHLHWAQAPSYVSPFTIAASVALLLCFSKISFYSRWINWIAASSFAVYLLHACTPFLSVTMKPLVVGFWEPDAVGLFVVRCVAFALGLFAACVLIDQVRLALWRGLSGRIWTEKAPSGSATWAGSAEKK